MSETGLRWIRSLSWLILGAWVVAGCGPERRQPDVEGTATGSPAEWRNMDPGSFFADLEERLLHDPELRIGFRITASGAFRAALEGELFLGVGNEVALTSQGTFGSDSVSLSLGVADGQLIGGNGERRFEEPAPAGLREARVIGLMRMGLLHNLARLVAGARPDRADGTVRSWVQARAFEWAAPGDGDDRHGISFQVWVDEQATADAVLWLDGGGRPVARDQTVRFPGGEMRVREEYEIR